MTDTTNSQRVTKGSLLADQAGLPLSPRVAFEIILKRRWMIALVTLVATALVAVYCVRAPKIYQAQTSVIIESLSPRVLSSVEEVVPLGAESFWSSHEFYETEYKVLQSTALAERVIQKLGLAQDPEFLGLQKLATSSDHEAFERAIKRARPADILLSKLTIAPVKESKMVLIQYKDSSPKRAAQLASVHAQAYIEYNLERRLSGAKTAAEWLGEQLSGLKDKLEESEQALYNFKRDSGILAQSLEDKTEQLKKVIEETSAALFQVQNKRIQLSARLEEIERAKAEPALRDTLPEVAQNPIIQELGKMHLALSKDLAQLQQRYGERYPKLVETRGQLDDLERRTSAEADKIIGGILADYRVTLSVEKKLSAALKEAQAEALELNRKSIDYNKLKRETDNNTRLYGVVMSRLKETDLTGLLRTNNVRIVDDAQVPLDPVSPRTSLNLLVAIVLGFVLGLSLALVIELLDNSVKGEGDVRDTLGLTFLGLVPNFTDADGDVPATKTKKADDRHRDLYVFEHQRSHAAECTRAIRTSITFMGADRPIRRLLLVSAKPAEGKTTLAVSLATTLALSGQKTVVVDTDLRRPRLHRIFGFGSELGLSNVLLAERSLEDVIRTTAVPNLHLLPCGPLPPSPSELLHTAKFSDLVNALSERYDRIIFDSPPLVAVTDAAILSSLCDGVVIVVRAGKTPRELVRRSLVQLQSANARVLGVVLNAVDAGSRQYGYYQPYYRPYAAEESKG